MVDQITSLGEHKIVGFEMVRMKSTSNQIDRTDQVLLDCCVLWVM